MIVDAWTQHPTLRLLRHETLAPLLRWSGLEVPSEEPPLSTTIAAMDAGGSTSASCPPGRRRRAR